MWLEHGSEWGAIGVKRTEWERFKTEAGGVWSLWYKPGRGLRLLPVEHWNGKRKLVAVDTAGPRQRFYWVATCEVCRGKFLSARDGVKYCSHRCRGYYHRVIKLKVRGA